MRISDWSSDVCSSDLSPHRPGPGSAPSHDALRRPVRLARTEGSRRARRRARQNRPGPSARALRAQGFGEQAPRRGGPVGLLPEDRKSVGEGKGVSVRVDSGGRRNIKKKNNTTARKAIIYKHRQNKTI